MSLHDFERDVIRTARRLCAKRKDECCDPDDIADAFYFLYGCNREDTWETIEDLAKRNELVFADNERIHLP